MPTVKETKLETFVKSFLQQRRQILWKQKLWDWDTNNGRCRLTEIKTDTKKGRIKDTQ